MLGSLNRRRISVALLPLLAVLSVAVLARAGDEDDRRRLVDEIDDLLEDTAGDLDGFASESSVSDLDRALDRTGRVKDKARELERVQGDDSKARDMASRYPGYADHFREAAASLRPLKEAQRTLDEQPRACQDRWRELEAKVRVYVDRNDPAGVTEIPKLAQEYGRPIVEALDRAARRKDELGRLRDGVRYFSDSDGRWSSVRSELHDAANEIYDYWLRKHEEVLRECVELSKLERSTMVEAAMAKLASSEQGRQAILKELAAELAEAQRVVTDVEADGDDSDVKSAERDADDARRLIERLKAAAGEDRKAREMADRWPAEIDGMSRALVALDEEKDYQFRVDKAPDRCRTEEDKIVRAADSLERLDPDKSDLSSIERATDGLDAITQSAREGLIEALRKAAEAKREVENLARQASGWSPGPSELRAIDEEIDESAADIAKHFNQAEATAQQVCAAPALGPAHPAVKKAKAKMFGDCTKAEFVPLRQAVVSYCKQGLETCDQRDSCSTLRAKRDQFISCRDARTVLRDRCYSRQRDTHDLAISETDKGRKSCEKFMTDNGC
ncbi:MAG: hypothetical protein IPL61_12615 [Myxococcales bacterium]|nr:hypothetical protein [Myxococcales bacterium]